MYLSGRQQKSTPTRNKRKTLPCVTRSDTRKKHKTGRQRIDRKAILAKRCTPKPTPTKDTDATTRQSPTPKESETDDPSPSNREVSKKLPLSPKISEDLSPVDIEIANKASKVSKSAEIKKTLHDALDPRVQKGKRDKKKKKRRRTGAVKTWKVPVRPKQLQDTNKPVSPKSTQPIRTKQPVHQIKQPQTKKNLKSRQKLVTNKTATMIDYDPNALQCTPVQFSPAIERFWKSKAASRRQQTLVANVTTASPSQSINSCSTTTTC